MAYHKFPMSSNFPLFETCSLLQSRGGARQPEQPLKIINIDTHETTTLPLERIEVSPGQVVVQLEGFEPECIGGQPPRLGDAHQAYFIELASHTLKGAQQTLRNNCGQCEGCEVCSPRAAMNLAHSGILLAGFHMAAYPVNPLIK
jgi:hypothetical protein